MALPKAYRLTIERSIVGKLRKTGKAVYTNFFSAYYVPNNRSESRFGIIIGTGISKNAVVRNRIRRVVQDELFRKMAIFTYTHDVMIYTKKTIAGVDTDQIREDVDELLTKIH